MAMLYLYFVYRFYLNLPYILTTQQVNKYVVTIVIVMLDYTYVRYNSIDQCN